MRIHLFNNTVYVGAGDTNSVTNTSGASVFGGPFVAGGKSAIANAITITICRGFFYIFFFYDRLIASF